MHTDNVETALRNAMETDVADLPPLPDLVPGAVAQGRRRKRRRNLAVVGVTAAVAAAVVAVPALIPGPAGDDGARSVGVGAVPPAPPASTATPTATQPPGPTDPTAKPLIDILRNNLPVGIIRVDPHDSPTGFLLTRAEGGQLVLAVTQGNPLPPGSEAPDICSMEDLAPGVNTPGKPYTPFGDCERSTLPDGSKMIIGRRSLEFSKVVEIVIVAPDGKRQGLASANIAPHGQTPPLDYPEMKALVGNPDVFAAIRASS